MDKTAPQTSETGTQLDADLLIRQALERGLVDEAGPAIDEFIAADPSHHDGWLLKGVHGLLSGDFANARVWFDEAMARGADRRAACLGRAQALLGCGRPRQAWITLTALHTEEPTDAEILHWVLRAGTALERWDELAEILEAHLAQEPEDHASRFAYAGVEVRRGRGESARAQHARLVREAPELPGLEELRDALSGRRLQASAA